MEWMQALYQGLGSKPICASRYAAQILLEGNERRKTGTKSLRKFHLRLGKWRTAGGRFLPLATFLVVASWALASHLLVSHGAVLFMVSNRGRSARTQRGRRYRQRISNHPFCFA